MHEWESGVGFPLNGGKTGVLRLELIQLNQPFQLQRDHILFPQPEFSVPTNVQLIAIPVAAWCHSKVLVGIKCLYHFPGLGST